jgi:hypothetical protein
MGRHRHNFDQFRFPLRGDMNVGKGIQLRQGHLGYFTEGGPYGPQEDILGATPPGERTHLTLQFAGATGYGYLSPDRLRYFRDELRKDGEFVDALYQRRDGRKQGGLEAVWELAFGKKLEYPKPRYGAPIIMNPASFPWVVAKDNPKVAAKNLGTFTERGIWAEMIRLSEGARWRTENDTARRLLFVLDGLGSCGGEAIAQHSAIQIEPQELADVSVDTETSILLFGLPPVVRLRDAAAA